MGKPWKNHGKTMGFRILHDFLEVSKYGNGGKNVSSDWFFLENLVVQGKHIFSQ